MGEAEVLDRFFERIAGDPGIDPGHIAVFMALYREWVSNGFREPVFVCSVSIMPLAKISGSSTYFRKLRYLLEAGYITYEPSHYGKKGSRVYFTNA